MEARIRVRLTPRARRDGLLGFQGDVLRVRVKAPPVEGRANDALLKLLAEALGVPRSRLGLVGGRTSRDKVVAVEGMDADGVRRRLELRVETRGSAPPPGPGPGAG